MFLNQMVFLIYKRTYLMTYVEVKKKKKNKQQECISLNSGHFKENNEENP